MKRRARLEVAFNFFLVLEEIKFHQQAESQLISKHTKTTEPKPHKQTSGYASQKTYWHVRKHRSKRHKQNQVYIYISYIYIYTKKTPSWIRRLLRQKHLTGKNPKTTKHKLQALLTRSAFTFFPTQVGEVLPPLSPRPHPSHCGEEAFLTKSMLLSNIASTSSLGTSASSVNKGCFNWREGKSARFETEGILPNQGRT